MSIMRLDAVRREIGDFVILDSISGSIARGERVGLVGPNGAGKTTMLRIVVGRDDADRGSVHTAGGVRIGMLGQESNRDEAFAGSPSVLRAVRSGAGEVERLEHQLAQLESAGAGSVQTREYAHLRERFDHLGGYHIDQRVEETLSGLVVPREDWQRSPLALSGGEQTRVALARLLVDDPDLLLLDEPTNHLDLAALEWLEAYLARREGALLVASHDRAFLDAVVTRIWELRDRRLTPFKGGYSAYLQQREAADARQRKDADTTTEQIAREKELIQRYRSHRKYPKMHEHERRLEALLATRTEAPRQGQRLALPTEALLGGGPARSGDVALSMEAMTIGFPRTESTPRGVPILRVARLEATRGERIGVVGPNGAGKTTLLRTVAGVLSPLDGFIRLGANVRPGYLAQIREAPIPGATVMDAILAAARVENGPARAYLARFLFRGEDVFKPVAELSGGERSRLELALLGITPANLLLLDEPTNHLDIPAREALEAFLRGTGSTMLIVSHDRRLLESVCGSLWVVEPGLGTEPGRVAVFDGGYAAWRAAVADGWTVDSALAAAPIDRRVGGVLAKPPPAPRQGQSNGTYPPTANRTKLPPANGTKLPPASKRPAPRLAPMSKDAYKRQMQRVEDDMTRLGVRKNQLELALGDPRVQTNFVELRRLTSELADVDGGLAQAEEAWLALSERAPR